MMRLKRFCQTAAVSLATVGTSFLFAASAHAAVGDLQAIKLQDTDHNGKVDRVQFTIDNTGAHTWAKVGTGNIAGFTIRHGSNSPMTISSMAFSSATNANPIVINATLDETTGGLPVDTSENAVGVVETQQTGDATCTDCFSDTTDNIEFPTIGAGDAGVLRELDYMQPILVAVTPSVSGTGVSRTSAVSFQFSEPMNTTFNQGDSTAAFTSSPNPGGWGSGSFSTTTYGNDTVTLTHAAFVKGGHYTFTFHAANIEDVAQDVSLAPAHLTFDASGTLVTLSSAAYSFDVTTAGSTTGGTSATLYVEPTSSCALLAPPTGSTLTGGSAYDVRWNGVGADMTNVLIRFSADGGQTWSSGLGRANDGSFLWTVPSVATDAAQLKIDCRDSGGATIASAVSGNFTIVADATVPVVAAPGSAAPAMGGSGYPVGTLLRADGASAVYYVGDDGRRRPFPNERIYFTWFPDFSAVKTVSAAELARLMVGRPMMPKPGLNFVKIQSEPKTYWIDPADGKLRWLPSEEIAARIGGADWNKKVIDIEPTFFSGLSFGANVQ